MDARALAFVSAAFAVASSTAHAVEPGHARAAVVLAAIDGALSESDRLDLEAALATGLKENDRFDVQPQAYVDQVLASSGSAGVRCGYSDDVPCWVKIGLAGDFDFLVVARAAPRALELRLIDVQHGAELKSTYSTVDGFGRAPVTAAVAVLLDAAPSSPTRAPPPPPAPPAPPPALHSSTAPLLASTSPPAGSSSLMLAGFIGAGIGGIVAIVSLGAIGGIEVSYAGGSFDGQPKRLEEAQWIERALVGAAGVGVVVGALGAGFVWAESP
jgi:hypothetical protein